MLLYELLCGSLPYGDDGTSEAVRGAFLATGLPYAADSFERVASALDRYARTWRTTDAEICEETLVRGERSPRLLDLGRLCLDGLRAGSAR